MNWRNLTRPGIAAVLGFTTALCAVDVAAQATAATTEDGDECALSFDAAQTHRKEGRLVEARAALEQCSARFCPEVIVDKCVAWLDEVDKELPTVVFVVKDGAGTDVLDVRVTRGDQEIAASLDGTPIALNPGSHTFQFHYRDQPPVEVDFVLRAAELNKAIDVRVPAPEPEEDTASSSLAPPEPASDASSVGATRVEIPQDDSAWRSVAWVGFGVAGAGLVAGAISGGLALSRHGELEDQCAAAPGCSEDDIQGGRTLAHVSTASFAVAGVGAALGVIVLLVTGADEQEAATVAPWLGPRTAGLNISF